MHLSRFWTRILANVPYSRTLYQEVSHMFIWWWKVYLPGTYSSSGRFQNQMTDTLGMDTLQAVLSHSAWKAPFFTFKNKSANVFNRDMALALLLLVSPCRENVFRKRLVAMEALLSPTSLLEGWKTFNHFKSPDAVNIPKFITIRMRKRQTRWFQKNNAALCP